MDKNIEDKCVWITCGYIGLMRSILKEKLNLSTVLGWKACLWERWTMMSPRREKDFRTPRMGLAEQQREVYNMCS